MTIMRNQPLLANPDIVFRQEQEGAFLFDPNTGELKCLNPIGGVIWTLCDGSRSMEQIKSTICREYPQIPHRTILEDLQTFIGELLDMGYLGYRLAEDLPAS